MEKVKENRNGKDRTVGWVPGSTTVPFGRILNHLDETGVDSTDSGFAIAASLRLLARAVELLGNGDAFTGPVPVGAIEGFGMELTKAIREVGEEIAAALEPRDE